MISTVFGKYQPMLSFRLARVCTDLTISFTGIVTIPLVALSKATPT